MARIPEHEIERLKKEISVERLAEARGIQLTRHGADLVGKCPFHDDRTPSLVITPGKNLWHCLGACNAGGTAIDWVMRAEGISFRHAVELLRADHLPLAASPNQPVKHGTVRKLPPPVAREADDRAMLLQVVDYYNETLKQSPEAMKYLESRGLKSSEMIDRFKLGFANRTLGYRLPAKNRAAGAEMRGRLQQLGILRESGHEHFNGSVVIPVFDAEGEVVEMYGRKITAGLREGTPLHLYLPGAHTGVWNEEAVAVSKEIILCEALIDALTFWTAGFRNVTASYGVHGFTEDHRRAFEKYGTERVYIAYDRDEAGDKSADTLAEELMGMGIECFRVVFPRGMDANDYARKVQPAAKSLGLLLNRAAWLGKGQRPAERVLVPVAMPEPSAPIEPTEEPAAKEKIIEEQVPEPGPAAVASIEAGPTEPVRADNEPSSGRPVPCRARRSARRRDLPDAGRPPLSRARLEQEYELRAAEGQVLLRHEYARRVGLPRRHAGSVLGAAAQRLRQTGLGGDGHEGRRGPARPGARAAEARRAAGRADQEGARAEAGRRFALSDEERATAMELLRDPRLLERIVRGLRAVRRGGRGDEQARWLSSRSVSRHLEAPLAVIVQSILGRRQKLADGSGAGVPAGRAARAILGDDGAVAVLHGRNGSQK